MAMDPRRQWLALSLTPGLGPATLRKLLDRFGSADQILTAGGKALAACSFLRKESLDFLSASMSATLAAAEEEIRRAERLGLALLCRDDPAYPPLLGRIADPPPVLYVRGNPAALSGPALAVVGARAASNYGTQVAGKLAGDLARQGLVIVSGLALGIDSAAHRGALAAGGTSVAVLGCGLDIIYPGQNRKLHDELAQNGAVVSEYPLGTQPEAFRFPARNRIISGLSLGVLVVEAARRSGTLITANLAIDQGRDVFAVPGRIDSPKSEGCHRLIQEGAKLVHGPDDILNELARPAVLAHLEPATPVRQAPSLAPEEERVFSLLGPYPKNIEELICATGLAAARMSEILLQLELRGLIVSLPGKQYQILA